MEMEHARIFQPEFEKPPEIERKESGESKERIAQAFIRQHYPLTEEGQRLKQEVEQALRDTDVVALEKLGRVLPTVENPRLELFQDLELSPEEEERVFGPDLANIQITKGCRHKCTFCAAGAAAKVETMPFAAVLKIAEKKQKWDKRLQEAWDSWVSLVREKAGFDLNDWSGSLPDNVLLLYEKEYQAHPLRRFVKLEKPFDKPTKLTDIGQKITNYYDSDPFDYRDPTFLHEDGTPADFGDVFLTLASRQRPVHITTAGWPETDRAAARSAQKIVKACKGNPDLVFHPRISVNEYEMTARRDPDRYREDMKKVIVALDAVEPEVMFFIDRDLDTNDVNMDFRNKVLEPLKDSIRGREAKGAYFLTYDYSVSHFSGPMADERFKDDHHDVMACMPGVHIWPDGSVNEQGKSRWVRVKSKPAAGQQLSQRVREKVIPEGSRPQPIGLRLYQLPKKGA